ncbi:MAG TPA: hypothetical protein VET83_05255 [Candidatus Dormibacteraeota bacterium]|nr:hypothetical protein [Candidatus Dormibacteraeota bacterium]
MALLHSIRTRPRVTAAVLGALAILVASVVPVSYQRVAGQDVALTLAGREIGNQDVRTVAQDLKSLLGSGAVVVDASAESGASRYVLRTTSTKRAGPEVQHAAVEFARGLAARGYSASVAVTPHRERVRYPAVAYAFDQIIRISVDGKSAAALEAEIRDKLAQAGVPDAQVSVTDHPGGGRDIRLNVERQHVGDAEPLPQVVLEKNGAALEDGEGFAVRIQKKKVNGATTLTLEVTASGKSAKVEVPNSDTMSDAAITDSVGSQLRQAGIDARVTVTNGKVEIEPVR